MLRRMDGLRRSAYSLNFVFSFILISTSYFFSTYLLSMGVPNASIGSVIAFGNLMAIVGLAATSGIIARIGALRSFIAVACLATICFVLLQFAATLGAIVLVAIVTSVTAALYMIIDLFYEIADNGAGIQGTTRGISLTFFNLAAVMAPAIAGILVVGDDFTRLFAGLAFLSVSLILIATLTVKPPREPREHAFHIGRMLKFLKLRPNLRHLFFIQFLLRVFYGTMMVYTPILLTQYAGFSVTQMGIALSIMIVPFLILEYPLGVALDEIKSPGTILAIGLLIMACTTVIISLLDHPILLIWALVLASTRVGAAAVDVGTDAAFFKQIKAGDSDAISAFRMLMPLGYMVGPLVAGVALIYVDIPYLYALLAAILLLGIPSALKLSSID